MVSTSSLLVFSGAALILLLVPGPAVLYIVAQSATQGRRAGLVSVAGVHTGTAVHVMAALLGLSALIVASATAFTVVKLAGAAYLIFMGVRALMRSTDRTTDGPGLPERQLRRVFSDAVIVNVLNPKTAVFFLAFVPQFVDPDSGHATTQLLILSATFVGLGIISDGFYAIAAGWFGERLSNSPTFHRRTNRAAATTYIGLGIATAVAGIEPAAA